MFILTSSGKIIKFGNKFVSTGNDIPPEPSDKVIIDGKEYGICQINDLYWTTEDLDLYLDDYASNIFQYEGLCYYEYNALNVGINAKLAELGIIGWRVPTVTDITNMRDFVKADNSCSDNNIQNYLFAVDSIDRTTYDKYGLSLRPTGAYDNSQGIVNTSKHAGNANIGYIDNPNNTSRFYCGNSAGGGWGMGTANGYKVTVRLVKDVS